MSTTIRPIERGDCAAVLALMREFARYEKLEQFLEITEDRLTTAMFGEHSFVNGLIAFSHEKPVGYAIFYPNFLTFRGQRGFFLEDLYVSQEARGSGIGRTMLSQIAEMALKRGFERIDLLVLEWNKTATAFYEKLGGVRADDERHFKFTDHAFKRLCSYRPG